MRFIARFTTTEVEDLMKYLATYPLHDRERVRFTAVRLNSERVPISELCDIFEVSRNTVQSWLKRYENGGFESLLDTPSARAVSSLCQVDANIIRQAVSLYPQDLTQAVGYLAEKHSVHTRESILRHYLKKKISVETGSSLSET